MTRHLITIVILTGAALAFGGCNNSNADTKAAADKKIAADLKAAADEKKAEEQAAADTKAAADKKIAADLKAATVAKQAADQAAADTKAAADKKMTDDLKAAAEAKTAADAAKAAADANMAKADTLLDQLQQHIKGNEMDSAEKALAKLDGMKDSLPAAQQKRIEQARSALAAKKSPESLLNLK